MGWFKREEDKRAIEMILHYCDKIDSHIEYFGDDKELFLENIHYQDACALVIIQIENILIDYLMNSKIVILRFLGEKLKI